MRGIKVAEKGKILTLAGGSLPDKGKEITWKTITNHKSSLKWVGNKFDIENTTLTK